MRIAAAALVVSALIALAVGPLHATAQDGGPLRLTLAEALEYAAGSNPGLRQAQNSTDLNPSETRALWLSQILPRASLTLFRTGFTGNLTRRATDNFGNPIANPGADWNYFSSTEHRLGLTWRVQGPSLLQAHRGQTLTNLDRDLALEGAMTDLQIEVRRRYTDALEQRELLRVEDELIESRTIDLDVAERLFGLALRTRVDVLAAELAVEQQRLAAQQQDAAYQRALLELRTAMGFSEDRSLELVDEALPIFDPTGLEAGELVDRAGRVNPALLRSGVQVRSNEVALDRARSRWWPEVALGVDVFRQAYEPYGNALFETSVASDLESRFFVQLSLPIFNDYFQSEVDRQRAAVELQNSREADRQARLQTEAAIRGALLDLENQWVTLRLAERSLVIAEEALRLAREEYRLGTRSFADLRDGFEQEAGTRRQVIAARYQFVDALLTLEEAVGAPVRGADGPGPNPEG